MPKVFGSKDQCMLMMFHKEIALRRGKEIRPDFVPNASHELRTPLAAVSGFINKLQGSGA